jgi:hypothetical protein
MATNVINIRRFVDVTTGVVTTPANAARDWGSLLFVQKGASGAKTEVTKYLNYQELVDADISNTEAMVAATKFYGTSYDGVAPTSPIYVATISADEVEDFKENFDALLASEDYYLIVLDRTLSDEQKKSAADSVEATASSTSHKLFLDDYSYTTVNDAEPTTSTVSGHVKLNAYAHTIVVWSNTSWAQESGDRLTEKRYYSAALASFYATRKFDTSKRQMCPVAHKAASGISVVDFTDPSVTVSPTQAYDNVVANNATVYISVKPSGVFTAWERGVVGNGNDLSDMIAADYLNYTLTVRVFSVLQAYPRVPMNSTGATMLATAINSAFMELAVAGVIGAGTSIDGETFSGYGYKYSIPIPTGVAKANGLWENITCSALLAGSAKKVVIGNTLKQ